MRRHRPPMLGTITALALALLARPVSAQESGKLFPADSDLLLTVNVRQFLRDHQDTPAVRGALDALRRALPEDSLGLDVLRDVDRITCSFPKNGRGTVVTLVAGRFQKDSLRAAVERLARDRLGSFKATEAGRHELWQLSGPGDGVSLVLLDDHTLAVTAGPKSRDAMAGVLGRHTGRITDGLSAGLRSLLAKTRAEHVALLGDRVDRLSDEIARQLPARDDLSRWAVQQLTAGIGQNLKDLSAAGLALNFGKDGVNARLVVEAKSRAAAGRLRTLIQSGNFWTALALQAVDGELTRLWATILVKQRFVVDGPTLTVHAHVPYAFLDRLGYALLETGTRQVTSLRLWTPPAPPPGTAAVAEVLDIAYRNGPKADPYRHRLDLFYPRGKKDFPVIVLVHGGGWTIGDNRCCGLYTSVGQFLASQGFGVVLPNYRLSPRVKHPEHVRDVARAVAWTRAHIKEYGGDPGKLFLMGHSAGGHLVALLATDETYLRAEGLALADVKGVVGVSGVYDIPPGAVAITLGGTAATACGVDQQVPLRGDGGTAWNTLVPPVALAVDLYGPPFGDNARDRAAAAPLRHVRPGLPPFLLLTAERDLPTLVDMAGRFQRALREKGCAAEWCRLERRNHNSVMFSMIRPDDPAARAVLEFLRKQ